jgi:tRNA nucleotidyltransferase (CCA-adding enzyme)
MGEWKKLLIKGKSISRGLAFLRETGWVKYYPELESLIGCKQDKRWHPEGDVWNHTLCSLDAFAVERDEHDYGDDENLIVALAVLCHDFGKPLTTRCEGYDGRIRSLGHDEAGVAPTISFLKRLTNEERILKEVPPLVKAHMRPFALWKNKSSDSAIRRLSSDVGRIDRLLRVASADEGGRPPFPRQIEHLEWLKSQSLRLAVADAVPKPILMGRDLMDIGMKPSKEFGIILKNAYEAQLDGEFFDKAGAMQFVRRKFR